MSVIRLLSALLLCLWCAGIPPLAGGESAGDLEWVARRVWQNECGGTVEGLTSWNVGEHFASLGIGHFIWYPAGAPKSFEESFPRLLAFLTSRGARPPAGFTSDMACPWSSREGFLGAANSERMTALRGYLAATVSLQAEFLAQRMEASLEKMTSGLPPEKTFRVQNNYRAVAAAPKGSYLLIDYVNFKGEGVNPAERYQGEGWGLLQVLSGMDAAVSDPRQAFSESAARVLSRRVQLAPKERREERWLAGWLNRCKTYDIAGKKL